jgi:hypothetical protein
MRWIIAVMKMFNKETTNLENCKIKVLWPWSQHIY